MKYLHNFFRERRGFTMKLLSRFTGALALFGLAFVLASADCATGGSCTIANSDAFVWMATSHPEGIADAILQVAEHNPYATGFEVVNP